MGAMNIYIYMREIEREKGEKKRRIKVDKTQVKERIRSLCYEQMLGAPYF